MIAPLVFVPEEIHADAIALLAQHSRVAIGYGPDGRPWSDIASEVTAVLLRTSPLTSGDLRLAQNLRVIARHGVGTDNIDVGAATDQGIMVTNTPGANARSVAEHAFALLLAVSRNIVLADKAVREGRFAERDVLAGFELADRRLGILGMGRIGTHVAEIATQGFGMTVFGYDPNLDRETIHARGAQPIEDLRELLASSDVLSVHVPLVAATADLIGDAELKLLPDDAVVLLTSRGGVVNEAALIAHLQNGSVRGAGVDVFDQEPPMPDCGYLGLPNVVLSPHTGAHSSAAMRRMAMGAAESIVAVLSGERPESIVNAVGLSARAEPL